jgi:pimeloyl-ACP methyl ester carboxylesterase
MQRRGTFAGFVMPAIFAAAAVFASACNDGNPEAAVTTPDGATLATATARPLPPPVAVSPEPQGIGLEDPAFTALPGAKADFGRLGGAVYQIEVPDDWNGRLVLYMHGFQGLAPKASVQPPGLRGYLIRNGYAWGASSYSSTSLIPGRAADETAAVWDYFAKTYGRPAYTYVTGHSMGGGATNIAAERYGDRFDGALSICGFAGQTAQAQMVTDWFFAGAYAASVTQEEFDATADLATLIDGRIVPALNDPARRETFESILTGLTGGPRAFNREGIHAEEATNWERAKILVASRIGMNADREYTLAPGTLVSSEEFNRGVIRLADDAERMASFIAGNEITGELAMPTITLHTTGDWQVPVDQEQILRRKVEAAGKGDLLVQRVIRDPYHCNTTATEWERSFEDLVAWVEKGVTPAGEDVLAEDLSQLGTFTLAPRLGLPEAEAVAGARERITLRGNITIDGQPANDGRYLWFLVERDGRRARCSFPADIVRGGRYERAVASADEAAGCGEDGAVIYGAIWEKDAVRLSAPIIWRQGAGAIDADLAFSTTDAGGTGRDDTAVYGTVLDVSGARLGPGARIEAYIGETLCGVGSLPPVMMQFSNPDTFDVLVAGPDEVAACARDATVRFVVNGRQATGTAINNQFGQNVDLVLE